MGARARRSASETVSAFGASTGAASPAISEVKVPRCPHPVQRKGGLENDDHIAALRALYWAIACEPIPPGILARLGPGRRAN